MKNSFLKTVSKDTRGATVFIALGIAFLLMVFSIGIATVVKSTNYNIKAFKESSRAKFIAEGVLGHLIGIGQEHEAGFSLTESECDQIMQTWDYAQTVIADEGATIKCQIKGRNDKPTISPTGTFYTVPATNTGDASRNCQPLRPVRTEADLRNMGITEISDPLDHPCNWGRLNFGNSITSRVAIPLYYDEVQSIGTDGTVQSEVRKLDDLNDLRIRVRTPCKPVEVTVEGTDQTKWEYPEICTDDDRYKFEPEQIDVENNPTVVMWQISATCVSQDGSEQSCGMTPDTTSRRTPTGMLRVYPNNSEIHKALIDAGLDIDINKLGEAFGFFGEDHTIRGFMSSTEVKDPTLQLAIITRGLKTRGGDPVPNLEYQIVGDNTHPLSNAAQIYEVTVSYQGQMYKATKSIETKKNVVDFAIQN